MGVKFLFVSLVLCVVFVNGWTDAPNAIASCVGSRSISPKRAVLLAGACNLIGALFAALFASGVAETVYSIVDFGDDHARAISSLCAGMSAVVIWALLAFSFGIPTSESHALMAGIVGAALGGRMSADAIDFNALLTVALGLLLSTLPAYLLAKWLYQLILRICSTLDRRRAMRYFMRAQKLSAAASAFMHGAQDSQKFAGVLMLGFATRGGIEDSALTLYLSAACAVVMALGTLCGGGRIIKKVGDDMVRLDASAGTAADAASSAVLALCTLLGVPVSTTHSKTCAMMGAGTQSARGVNGSVVRQMILAWVLTFPSCALLGFLLGIFIG